MRKSATWQRILRLVNRLESSLRRDVLRALSALANSISTSRIAQAIASGRSGDLERIVADLPMRLRRVERIIERAATDAALLQQLQAVNPLAVQAARAQTAKLIRDITNETRQAITTAITDAVSARITTIEAAKVIKASIGLTSRQAKAVVALRQRLVAAGLSQAVVDARVARYGAKLLAYRAKMIARTEIMRAANAGVQAAWEQAQRAGQLRNLARTWITTPDDRLCPICAPLEGQRRSMTEPFVSPTNGQAYLIPPAHPNCRCTVGLVAVAVRRTVAA